MIGAVILATALLALDLSGFVSAQTCPSSGVQVTSKLILQTEEASSPDSIRKLASCLGLQDCQLSKFDFGQCGSSKIQRVEGAAKAAVIAFDPAGCTEVYNCAGVFVDSDVYNTVRACSETSVASISLARVVSSRDTLGNLLLSGEYIIYVLMHDGFYCQLFLGVDIDRGLGVVRRGLLFSTMCRIVFLIADCRIYVTHSMVVFVSTTLRERRDSMYKPVY
jgi:hypothetical protein